MFTLTSEPQSWCICICTYFTTGTAHPYDDESHDDELHDDESHDDESHDDESYDDESHDDESHDLFVMSLQAHNNSSIV